MKKALSLALCLCMLFMLAIPVAAEGVDPDHAENVITEDTDYNYSEETVSDTDVSETDTLTDIPSQIENNTDLISEIRSKIVDSISLAERSGLSVNPDKAPTEVPAEFPNSALLEITDDDYLHGVVNIYYYNGIFYTDATCTNQFRGIWINLNYPFHSYQTLQDIFTTAATYNDNIEDDGVAFANVNVRIDKINIHMMSTYMVSATETISGMDWVSAYQPNYDKYSPYVNIIRNDGFYGPMLNVATPDEEHLVLGPEVTVDNRVSYPDFSTVAIEVPDYGNLMLRGGKITNSLSGATRETYAGIGVKLTGVTNGGALELWYNCVIEKCHIASDQICGTTRLKEPTPGDMYTVRDNYIAINVRRGTTIGKWTSDISMIEADDVIITLEDVKSWQDGDIIMTSGQENLANNERVNTPVIPEDIAKIKFTNRDDMSQVLSLSYDDSVSSSVNMLFPLIRFATKIVYNTRTHEWFTTLYDALKGGDYGILENDTLVFYGYSKETHECAVNINLTIRSAVPGFDTAKVGYTPPESGAAASWVKVDAGHIQCFSVLEGKKVYLGTGRGVTENKTVPLTFNFNGASRGLYTGTSSKVYMDNFVINEGRSATNGGGILMGNSSYLEATMNTKIKNCSAANGGGIYVGSAATFTVSAGSGESRMSITGCKAQFGGGMYIYGGSNTPGDGDGVVNFNGGSFSKNNAPCGASVYQNGKFNLSGDAKFDTGDVYLPSLSTADTTKVRVITDVGYSGNSIVYVGLGNDTNTYEYVGRNYVEGTGVTPAKFEKYTVTNVKEGLECTYTDVDALIGSPVLELKAVPSVSLTITKSVDVVIKDDQSFIFRVTGQPGTAGAIDMFVTINGSGSVTIKNLPIGVYSVTEETAWSYRYTNMDGTITKTVDTDGVTFDFMNYLSTDKWLTYDCFAQNMWNETGTSVTRKH